MNEVVLARKYKWLTTLILALLLLSLYFNIKAFVSPFLDVDHFWEDKVYSLVGTIGFLWQCKLYIISILCIVFSVIFPFLLLVGQFLVCFILKDSKIRLRLITIFGALAKWSMFEIFMVCVVLMTSNNKYFYSATSRLGVYYFLVAVSISILSLLLLTFLCEKTHPDYAKKLNGFLLFVGQKLFLSERVIMLILVITGSVFFFLSIVGNYIGISAFFLQNRSFSLISSWMAIHQISTNLAVLFGLGLIIIPFIIFNDLLIFWSTSYQPAFHFRIVQLIKNLSKFMMLDVLFLSLFLYLYEGTGMIEVKNRGGLGVLVLLVFISFVLPLIVKLYSVLRYRFARRDT